MEQVPELESNKSNSGVRTSLVLLQGEFPRRDSREFIKRTTTQSNLRPVENRTSFGIRQSN